MAWHDRIEFRGQPEPIPRDAGDILRDRGEISAQVLAMAQRDAARDEAGLEAVLAKSAGVAPDAIAAAQAALYRTSLIDPLAEPPDPRLCRGFEPDWLMRNHLLPWRSAGGATVVLTDQPERFEAQRATLEARLGPVRLAIVTCEARVAAATAAMGPALALRAERRLPLHLSARGLSSARYIVAALVVVGALGLLSATAPAVALRLLLGLALCVIAVSALLRLAALAAALSAPRQTPSSAALPLHLPVVTLLVPLLHERDIAARLLGRLAALDYPRHLLDICLILEDSDHLTRHTIAAAGLPPWMRQIVVPRGTIRTKPRALNHALDSATGSIIGIYDAEDAPDPDQIRKVVAAFAALPADVACLQGRLDYYNDSQNWLTRCFTLDYAAWFRVVLPGFARLGLALPLGGTTIFLRRDAIEALGGWDAHNVTEDADLGLRIARRGYRTMLLDSVTGEEAVARLWPWIRQRSRWTKGYAQTWAVHSREPLRLWRRIGTRRMLAMQVMFLGTLMQPMLAPLVWALPFSTTLRAALPFGAPLWLWLVLPAVEVLTLVTAAIGASRAGKLWLLPWVPTMLAYFPLATIAAWKACVELVVAPFYWDKTAHGQD